ncbi:MAG: hypothetical protein JWN03_4063 [Nocardia sp.]|uniref:hypothetical protein n=1 Tax=Nocardia sp. TaxID=1821 RepID=UPI0026031DFE|nr:hypothetical protein [Nocardia sp.]MCU1643788.1 hypothetical protein [Nocardia sp.]
MTSLAGRAEVVKLARELHTAPDELGFLLESDPVAIRRVRQSMHHALDSPYRPMFERLAKVSALIPNTLAIAIATRFFGPMLCGMIATSLSPERAVALIGHVPTTFLADTAPYVDPTAAAPIVQAFDTDVLVPVMQEMVRRKDYVTLARFLVAATNEQLLEVVPHIHSGEDLLQVGFNAELDTVADRFDVVLAELPEHRIREILQAAHDQDRFAEAFTFLQFVSDKTLTRVSEVTAGLGPELLTHMVESVHRENAWAEMIPVAALMSPESRQLLFELPVWDDEKLAAVARAAEHSARQGDLLKIIEETAARLD